MFYDIDIYRWAWLLLPPVLRRTRIYALLCVLLLPLHRMLNAFRAYRESAIRRVNVNGQVIYIEKALNDAFSPEERGIYITDTPDDAALLYPEAEHTLVIHEAGAAETAYVKAEDDAKYTADYVVNVPFSLALRLEEIRAVVEYNKPAGRSYEIKTYQTDI